MAIVCDTGGVYALYDADDSHNLPARQVIQAEPGPLLLPVVLLAEIDYLLSTRLGADAALDFLQLNDIPYYPIQTGIIEA